MMSLKAARLAGVVAFVHAITLNAQEKSLASVPSLAGLVARPASDLAEVVERFTADLGSLNRRYDAAYSPAQRQRMREFYDAWRMRLRELDFDKLGQEGKVDYVLLDNYLQHQLALLDRQSKLRGEASTLAPFTDRLLVLQDSRRNLESIDQAALARTLSDVAKNVDSLRALFEPASRPTTTTQTRQPSTDTVATPRASAPPPRVSRTVANRSAENIDELRRGMIAWYRFYDGYDPLFSWWARDPYRKLDSALIRYARTLRERVVGVPPNAVPGQNQGPIVGDPIGVDGLKEDLRYEMIPYTPEELIAIAQREYAFSLSEMKKASRDLGFGDNWKAAMKVRSR